MRQAQWRAALLLYAMTLAGCALPMGGEVRVHIENQTDAPVAVYVNGGWVGTYPAGTATSAPVAGHGGPPYTVAAEIPAGPSSPRWWFRRTMPRRSPEVPR